MRTILFFVCFCLISVSGSAQMQQSATQDNTVFREGVVRRLIKYIKISKTVRQEADHLADRAGYKKENIGVHGTIGYLTWRNDWCEFHKLNTSENHEAFDLRLAHRPELRAYAAKILNRDVAKKGFDWHLQGFWDGDYASEDKGEKLGRKFFMEALAKHGFKPCV